MGKGRGKNQAARAAYLINQNKNYEFTNII